MVQMLTLIDKTDIEVFTYGINNFFDIVALVVALEPQPLYSLSVKGTYRNCNLD